MRFEKISLLANHTISSILKEPINKWLVGLLFILIAFSLTSAFTSYLDHKHIVDHYSEDVRDLWENNPDKHPHRMAHYGYVVFRSHYPMSFFDLGLNSFLGNSAFLEAHRQNSINFSRVSLSNGLLRFGELSAGLILQLLLPLVIFFWGFGLVAGERESGILKLIIGQGVLWSENLIGRAFGLFLIGLLIFIPTALILFVLLLFTSTSDFFPEILSSFGITILSYLLYLLVMSLLAVWISAVSKTKKAALVKLIGCWLFFTLIFPKISQVAGQVFHPTPSKIAFDAAIEQDIVKQGDSHNPDDPLFSKLRDSVLAVHNVSSTNELPFNYSGFIMSQGEQLSTMTYREHQEELMTLYDKQNRLISWTALLNPYIAIKNISMSLSGTDFSSYRHFDQQAEEYRYQLAQTMNNLQMKYISNVITTSADKDAVISRRHWTNYPDFEQSFLSFSHRASNVNLSFMSLALWLSALIALIVYRSKSLSTI